MKRYAKLKKSISEKASPIACGQDTFQNPYLSLSSGSEINPKSSRFKASAWIKNLVGFVSKDPTKYPRRTASVCFCDLNVYGFGTPTDYQKTVGGVLLEIGSISGG
jgi:ATP-binding cassette subfamily G (WHITE) protein 2 (PDR)